MGLSDLVLPRLQEIRGLRGNSNGTAVRGFLTSLLEYLQAVTADLDAHKAATGDHPITTGATRIQFTPGAAPAHARGNLWYDDGEDTLAFQSQFASTKASLMHEQWMIVRNVSGGDIPNGTPVYIVSSDSGLPTIAKAKADALLTAEVAGLTTMDIANGSNGAITTFGVIHGMDTRGFNAGDPAFLSAVTAGALATEPTLVSIAHRLGIVMTVGENGNFFVQTRRRAKAYASINVAAPTFTTNLTASITVPAFAQERTIHANFRLDPTVQVAAWVSVEIETGIGTDEFVEIARREMPAINVGVSRGGLSMIVPGGYRYRFRRSGGAGTTELFGDGTATGYSYIDLV